LQGDPNLAKLKYWMKIEITDEARFDAALAHGLARVALGLNIAMHGYGRLPNLAGFANGMVKQFAATFLPGPLSILQGLALESAKRSLGHSCFLGCFVGRLLSLVHY
jgi:hypothetical protein